jgi:hypothetical protein
MPQGGTLTVRMQEEVTHIAIQVCDTGAGISADSLPQIFAPLYTTKPRGTGFGLYLVQEIPHSPEFRGSALRGSQYACHFNTFPSLWGFLPQATERYIPGLELRESGSPDNLSPTTFARILRRHACR